MTDSRNRWQKLSDHVTWLENEIRELPLKRETATNLEAAHVFLERTLRDFPPSEAPATDCEGDTIHRMALWLLRSLAEEID